MNEKDFGERIERIRKLLTKGTPTPAKVLLAALNKEFTKHRAIGPAFADAFKTVPTSPKDVSIMFTDQTSFLNEANLDQARAALRHIDNAREGLVKLLNESPSST